MEICSLNKALAIYKKEINSFLKSSSCLIFFGGFNGVMIFNFFWLEKFFARNILDVRPLFESMPLFLIFLSSAITMRMWAEEKREGTIELLLTTGISNSSLVIGKFLSCTFIITIAILTTIIIPLLLSFAGPLDWPVIFSGYFASILLGMGYISFGLWSSLLFSRQITSLLFSSTFLIVVYAVGLDAIETILGGWGKYLSEMSPVIHFEAICRGIIDIVDLIYYIIFIILFLLLTIRSLDRFQYKFASISWKEKRVSKTYQAGILFLLNIFILYGLSSTLNFLRFDLTKGQHYSLSDASLNYIKNSQEPILLRGYFSEATHPLLAPLVPRIEDLLKEYEILSEGKIIVEFFDPSDYPELEKEANQKYSISPTPFQFSDRYQSSVVNSYFNLLVELGDQHEILTFEDLIEVKALSENDISVHLRNPEYDITKTIRNLINRYQSLGSIGELTEEPIKLTGFFSEDDVLPIELRNLKMMITKYLLQKVKEDPERFEVEIINPVERTESFRSELFEGLGYQPVKIFSTTSDDVWFYLSASIGGEAVDVPLSLNLNEDTINLLVEDSIKKILGIGRDTIGFFVEDSQSQEGNFISSQNSQLRNLLGDSYAIKELDAETLYIEEDIDLLLLIAPRNLTSGAIFAIDQFLMKGNSVILLSSPFDVSSQGNDISLIPYKSGLHDWLLHNGIEIKNELVSDIKNSSFPIPVDRDVGGYTIRETQLINYPFFIDVRQDVLEESKDINQGLDQVTITWSSPINIDYGQTENKYRVFLKSSAESWTSSNVSIQPNFSDYPELGFEAPSEKSSANLGVIMDGKFNSYFEKIPEEVGVELKEKLLFGYSGVISKSTFKSRLIVISSNNFISDPVVDLASSSIGSQYLKPLNLIENLIDWSLEDIDLLEIRGRSQFVNTLPPLSKSVMIKIEFAIYGLALLLVFSIWFFSKFYFDRKRVNNSLKISRDR